MKFKVPFILFILGLLYLLLSMQIGIYNFEISKKEIGYIQSLNWGFVYIFILPIVTYTIFLFSEKFQSTIDRLMDKKMLFIKGNPLNPISYEDVDILVSLFSTEKKTIQKYLNLAFLVIIALCINEWWINSGYYALNSDLPIENIKPCIRSWTVAFLTDNNINPIFNILFSFVLYVFGQGLMVCAIFMILTNAGHFINFFLRLSGDNKDMNYICILPSTQSGLDKRFGFEVFEDAIKILLFQFSVLYLLAFLVVAQAEFLCDDTATGSMLSFLFDLQNFNFFDLQNFNFFDSVVKLHYSQTVALSLTIVYLIFIIFTFGVLLSNNSKNLRIKLIDYDNGKYISSFSDKEKKVLAMIKDDNQYKTWPIGWVEQTQSIIWFILFTGGLFFIKLFPYIFALKVGTIVYKITHKQRKERKK